MSAILRVEQLSHRYSSAWAIRDINFEINKLNSIGKGLTVFASSRGEEQSYEDPSWQNGAFTASIVKALAAGMGDADGNRDLRFLKDCVLDMTSEHREFVGHADIDEGFVDRVELDLICPAVVVQYIHDTMRELIIERVITRDDGGVVSLEQLAVLKEWRCVGNAEGLHLVAARDYDAIVV